MLPNTSPIIQNGQLMMTGNGNLLFAPDIQTQMPVTITAYNCIYNYVIASGLIPYFQSIPKGGFTSVEIVSIITRALQILITDNVITDLKVSVQFVTQNVVAIKISAIDAVGTPVSLTWDNSQINL